MTKSPANSEVRYGEITGANLERHVVRRLTYNPDFEALTGAMLEFLADPNAQTSRAAPRNGRLDHARRSDLAGSAPPGIIRLPEESGRWT